MYVSCLPVSVYNLAQGSGVKIGDSVAIPEPYLQHVKVDFQQHVCICVYRETATYNINAHFMPLEWNLGLLVSDFICYFVKKN